MVERFTGSVEGSERAVEIRYLSDDVIYARLRKNAIDGVALPGVGLHLDH